MEPYKLDASLDANKVFVVKRSELDSRIDPIFYGSDLTKFNKKFTSVKFSSVVSSFKSGVGAGKQDQAEGDEGIIQIRPTNIDNFGNLKFDKNVFLPYAFKGDKLKVDDVLFNNTNSQELVGKTAILLEEKELFYSNHITRIVVDKSQVLPLYIWIILNIYQENKIFYALCTNWNNQSGVGLELLKSLPIPLPPIEIQENIVSIIQNAYTQKQAKEAEAKELLASIDTYLLNELGITLPEKDNSLEARIFTTKFSEVVGGRFDPKLYDKTTTELKKAIVKVDKTKFITKRLKDILLESVAGDWGIEDEEQEVLGYTKCLVIRATEFNNDYNLSLDNSRVKYRLIKDEKLTKLNIKEGDLLIEKSGGSPDQPVGRIAILTKEELNNRTLAYSNFIHKISVDTSIVNPSYLFAFLKTIHNIKLTEAMQSQTNGIRNLIMSTYLGQKIVLPINDKGEIDLDKQKKIAEHIASIRTNAKSLQQEAEQILAEAKQRVEEIILG